MDKGPCCAWSMRCVPAGSASSCADVFARHDLAAPKDVPAARTARIPGYVRMLQGSQKAIDMHVHELTCIEKC